MKRTLAVVMMLCGLWSVLRSGDDYDLIRAQRFDSPRAWDVWLDRLGTLRGEPQVAQAVQGPELSHPRSRYPEPSTQFRVRLLRQLPHDPLQEVLTVQVAQVITDQFGWIDIQGTSQPKDDIQRRVAFAPLHFPRVLGVEARALAEFVLSPAPTAAQVFEPIAELLEVVGGRHASSVG